ncbi:MAG: sialate O-acetylesterase [Planctomycetota bacterium]
MPNKPFFSLLTVLLIGFVGLPCAASAAEAKKLQIYIMAGQSNMQGHSNFITLPQLAQDKRPEVQALAELVFKPGQTVSPEEVDAAIVAQMQANELNQKIKKKEITGEDAIAKAREQINAFKEKEKAQREAIREKLAVSEQVYITAISGNNVKSGPLSAGYGASTDKLGPELGFGMAMAKKTEAPILIIKTAWGGKSLEYNFRPPSAGPYLLLEKQQKADNKDEIKANAGQFYRLMAEKVDETIQNLDKYHPEYDAKAGFEIAGFVWFQGFNDQFSDQYRDNYKDNMVTFVKDVRKEFKAPDMPFVIGVMGTPKTDEKIAENKVSMGQIAAAQDPSIKDNVTAVKSHKFWDWEAQAVFDKGWAQNYRQWAAVGSDRPYHYLGSGKFFVTFGNALADAMEGLHKK